MTRRHAIIWTNDGKFTDAYLSHSASMSQTGAGLVKLVLVSLRPIDAYMRR